MSASDVLNLNQYEFIRNLNRILPFDSEIPQCMITTKENVLFMWDYPTHCAIAVHLRLAKLEGLAGQRNGVLFQKLLPFSPSLYPPEWLVVNDSGSTLVAVSPNGLLIFELPPRCAPYGVFGKNQEVIYCRTHRLDARLLANSYDTEVQQVKFHPGSVNDNHFLLLCSDNTLRLYKLENDVIHIATYLVGDRPLAKLPSSRMSFLGALGETIVDFDFGHPEEEQLPEKSSTSIISSTKLGDTSINLENKSSLSKLKSLKWPVYLISGDSLIFVIDIPLDSGVNSSVRGPFPMKVKENINCNVKASSILCLNTSPQIISISFSNGEILHAVITRHPANVFELSEVSEGLDRSINVFEFIELELGYSTVESAKEKLCTSVISLKKYDLYPDRYFAVHTAGVHLITISCYSGLQKFFNSQNTNLTLFGIFSRPSIVKYLLCTKTNSSEMYNPIIGFACFSDPPAIIALLGDGLLVSLPLPVKFLASLDEENGSDDAKVRSTSKRELQALPFQYYIENILNQCKRVPVIKMPKRAFYSQKEYYELLHTIGNIMRINHFPQYQKAKEEIERRVKMLKMLQQHQQVEIFTMKSQKKSLQDKVGSLAEKYEDIKDKQDRILRDCQSLIITASKKKNFLSHAEKDYLEHLKAIQFKLGNYAAQIEKLKTQKEYQDGKIALWKAQREKEKKSRMIPDFHKTTIEHHLLESSKKITNMITEVEDFRIFLDL